MNLSGILVVAKSGHLDSVVDGLGALPGVEVHHRDDDTGRLIVVQEAASIDDEVEGLKRIKGIPHVILAEMTYHYFGEDEHQYRPDEVGEVNAPSVPPYLND